MDVPDLSIETYNYSILFEFERTIDEPVFFKYIKERWTDCFIYSAVYVMVIFSIQSYMKNRRRYDLRRFLGLWSGVLAAFSVLGSIRTLPEFISSWRNHSLQYSLCVPTCYNGVNGAWGVLFTTSKVFELGDTLFIVLRKRPLIFLHWYHHVTVMIYSWYSYSNHTAAGRWFMTMNFAVHAVMYTYYALKAMQIYVPGQVNQLITSMQLSQMVVGILLNIKIYYIKRRGEYCQQSYTNLAFGTAMYFTYFLLFAQFFYNTYLTPKHKSNGKTL